MVELAELKATLEAENLPDRFWQALPCTTTAGISEAFTLTGGLYRDSPLRIPLQNVFN